MIMRPSLVILPVLMQSIPSATATFVVNYKAEFTYFLGAFCNGEYPVLMAFCQAGGQIQLVEDPVPDTVVCVPTPALDLPEDASSGLTCTTDSCESSNDPAGCIDAWRTSLSVDDGNFGEIHYSCSGESTNQVGSYFSFLNSGTGTCEVCTYDVDTCILLDNFNFHVARLSVLCPPFESADDYVNEDTFTECCLAGFSFQEILWGGPQHAMNCGSGDNCEFSACEVEFGDDLTVVANPYAFQHCIQASDASGVSTPMLNQPPVEPATNSGSYKAEFVASFGFFMNEPGLYTWYSNLLGSCFAEMPTTTLRIVCSQNGKISFVESTASTVTCENEGSDTLLCKDSAPLSADSSIFEYVNGFQQIFYVSAAVGCALNHLPGVILQQQKRYPI